MDALNMPMNNDDNRRRRGRNIALGLVLGALAILFYLITMVKMMGHGGGVGG